MLCCGYAVLVSRVGDPVAFHDTLAMRPQRIARIAISQRPRHIVTAEQHLIVIFQRSHASELAV